MECRFRVRPPRLLGVLAATIALASCGGGDSTQETTTTITSRTTNTAATTTHPPPRSSTTTVTEAIEAAADFDIRVDAYTEWEDVFDTLTTTEQECLRDSFEGGLLESVLARSVMPESDTPQAWEESIISCLAPQTTRALFLAFMVAGMEEEGLLIDTDAKACLDEWVEGIDVAALSNDDTEVATEVTTALMRCNPNLVISSMLEETGLTLEDLSEEEATCLREWATNTDWTPLITGSPNDPELLADFFPDLIACAPNLVISSMLEETGLTLEDLSEEEATCLREWVTNTDWVPLISLIAGSPNDPELLGGIVSDLIACAPDIFISSMLEETGQLQWNEIIEHATPLGMGVALQGDLNYEGDSDYYTFEAEEGESYQLDVTLGTLEDSVLDLYNANGTWLDGNDDYAFSTASRLYWTAPGTDTYYVQVTSYDYGTGTYTLTVAHSRAAS